MKDTRIAIIGAGPVGLEAGLQALERGYPFTIYERCHVADAVSQWGHVRMFSPFAMNSSPGGLARLLVGGARLPRPEAILTGSEFRQSYLLPLAEMLRPNLREQCQVRAIGRVRRLKTDFIANPERASAPFRLLIEDKKGQRLELADVVLDCSGNFAQPNSLGEGMAVPGEEECAARISYRLSTLREPERERLLGRSVLVVGAGHSAATAVRELAGLEETKLFWMTRKANPAPVEEVPGDPLPERAGLTKAANQLAKDGRVHLLAGAAIEALVPRGEEIAVHWSDVSGQHGTLLVDHIVAATGFRPDLELTRELQVQTCWATEGSYRLSASLLGEDGTDCLSAPSFGVETLFHPEPGYLALGMKSYGRSSNFLLRTGYKQVGTAFEWLERKPEAERR